MPFLLPVTATASSTAAAANSNKDRSSSSSSSARIITANYRTRCIDASVRSLDAMWKEQKLPARTAEERARVRARLEAELPLADSKDLCRVEFDLRVEGCARAIFLGVMRTHRAMLQ